MTQENTALVQVDSEAGKRTLTPMELLSNAQSQGATIEQMQQLMDLQERWEAKEARKSYNCAIAEFRAEGVKIRKGKHVQFQTQKGVTEYDHATLGNVVEQIVPAMSKYGLSNNWETEQKDNGSIKVTCRISHIDGHSETFTIEAPPDDSGGKNRIQQIGSTITYLQRYTLLAGTGLATHGMDDDGEASSNPEVEVETITEQQEADLLSLMAEVKCTKKYFCTYYKIDEVAELPDSMFNKAVSALESRRK